MKFTLSWLKQHLETDASAAEIAEKLTMIGLEVEAVIDRAARARLRGRQGHRGAAAPERRQVAGLRRRDRRRAAAVVCGAPNAAPA